MGVLRAELDLAAVDRLGDRLQRGEGRAQHGLDAIETGKALRHAPGQIASLTEREVHLPVPVNNQTPHSRLQRGQSEKWGHSALVSNSYTRRCRV